MVPILPFSIKFLACAAATYILFVDSTISLPAKPGIAFGHPTHGRLIPQKSASYNDGKDLKNDEIFEKRIPRITFREIPKVPVYDEYQDSGVDYFGDLGLPRNIPRNRNPPTKPIQEGEKDGTHSVQLFEFSGEGPWKKPPLSLPGVSRREPGRLDPDFGSRGQSSGCVQRSEPLFSGSSPASCGSFVPAPQNKGSKYTRGSEDDKDQLNHGGRSGTVLDSMEPLLPNSDRSSAQQSPCGGIATRTQNIRRFPWTRYRGFRTM